MCHAESMREAFLPGHEQRSKHYTENGMVHNKSMRNSGGDQNQRSAYSAHVTIYKYIDIYNNDNNDVHNIIYIYTVCNYRMARRCWGAFLVVIRQTYEHIHCKGTTS
jgi:hypothetical protein